MWVACCPHRGSMCESDLESQVVPNWSVFFVATRNPSVGLLLLARGLDGHLICAPLRELEVRRATSWPCPTKTPFALESLSSSLNEKCNFGSHQLNEASAPRKDRDRAALVQVTEAALLPEAKHSPEQLSALVDKTRTEGSEVEVMAVAGGRHVQCYRCARPSYQAWSACCKV